MTEGYTVPFFPFPGMTQKQIWNYYLNMGGLSSSGWLSGFREPGLDQLAVQCSGSQLCSGPFSQCSTSCVFPARAAALPASEKAGGDPAGKPASCLEAFRHPLYKSMFQYLLRTKSAPQDAPER